jgi:dTDP-4-dehydrorhamnose reductase
MKVLITGAGGQLGSDLIPRLYCAGFEVLSLNSAALDITDKEALGKAAGEFSPDIIVNCAAYTLVDKAEEESELAFRVNFEGAKNLAEAALENKALLIHISTDFVFDGEQSKPYTESDATNPLSVYGKSKLKGEEETLRSGCDSIIIRTSWLYGTGGKNFVKTILRLAKEKKTLKVVDDQIGSPTWTGDLAGAIAHIAALHASGDNKTGIYNYTNRGGISWYEFAVAIVKEARALGEELKCERVEPIPSSEYPTPAKRPAYSVLSTEKFERDFDILIEPWRGSLRKMLIELQGARDA